ncbi:MAG: type 1 glutamine amidotransferase [bacterium]|nr:MAG: type 1 glutamine amidotransferase [bacterium]
MVLIFQHDPFEGPGLIADMLEGRGIPFVVVEAHEDDPFPLSPAGYSGIVSLGGPMSANEDLFFLNREKAFLAEAGKRGIPILGVCLGAQLLASALGARIYPGEKPEVGWGEVRLTPEGGQDRILTGVDDVLPVLHWHGDTFDLPKDAVLLASTAEYPHQAFRWGDRAYGFQFHLEINEEMVRDWVKEDTARDGGLISDPDPILSGVKAHLAKVNLAGSIVFGRFLDMTRMEPPGTADTVLRH